MRDRRNTSLSISSVGSIASNASILNVLAEKKYQTSPPPSPELPPPNLVRPPPKKRSLRRDALIKLLGFLCIALLLWRLRDRTSRRSLNWSSGSRSGRVFHLASPVEVGSPRTVSALVATDADGASKWTVSIPPNASFPLPSSQYRDLCKAGASLREGILASRSHLPTQSWLKRHPRYTPDDTYLDVADAEAAGLFSQTSSPSIKAADVCDRSLTFVLGADDSSFGDSLLMMWMAYGLAQVEGRAFFIDDSTWIWGSYSTYFLPPPSQDCSPPPSHHIVPCPHTAKHVLVSPSTSSWFFDKSFYDEYLNKRKHGIAQQHRIYDLARVGYEALFKLVAEDSLYIASRITTLHDAAATHHTGTIGMHIRRGDLRPFEFQYSRDYLPIERYATRALALRDRLTTTNTPQSDPTTQLPTLDNTLPPLLLASDDPETLTSPDLTAALFPSTAAPAQDRILLATKATLAQAAPVRAPGSAYVKHVDENSGWERGFYAPLLAALASAGEASVPVREAVGRAYVLDLAVLGTGADGVVCGVAAAGCRVLGVMMGWEAVVDGRWVNVDFGRKGWSWDGSM